MPAATVARLQDLDAAADEFRSSAPPHLDGFLEHLYTPSPHETAALIYG